MMGNMGLNFGSGKIFLFICYMAVKYLKKLISQPHSLCFFLSLELTTGNAPTLPDTGKKNIFCGSQCTFAAVLCHRINYTYRASNCKCLNPSFVERTD